MLCKFCLLLLFLVNSSPLFADNPFEELLQQIEKLNDNIENLNLEISQVAPPLIQAINNIHDDANKYGPPLIQAINNINAAANQYGPQLTQALNEIGNVTNVYAPQVMGKWSSTESLINRQSDDWQAILSPGGLAIRFSVIGLVTFGTGYVLYRVLKFSADYVLKIRGHKGYDRINELV